MINKVIVTNSNNETLELELTRPDINGIYIRSIEGLGPPKANINISEDATDDGGRFNSARVDTRNIVLTLGFLFQPTIEDIRLKTYKYFPVKGNVKIEVVTSNNHVSTMAHVEYNEPNIFSEHQTTQISLLCADPFFYSISNMTTMFSGVEPMFEFPFSNESLTERLLIMSELKFEQEENIFYPGNKEVGVEFHINAIGAATELTIYHIQKRQKISIDSAKLKLLTGKDISKGDEIIISTVKGNKYAILIREGVTTNILNCITKDSNWLTLKPGDNIFVYSTAEGATSLLFDVRNRIAYEGV